MNNHTPGPWGICEYGGVNGSGFDVGHNFCHEGFDRIAKVNGLSDEQKANARLIAAAPELLEALEDIFPDVEYAIDDMTGAHFLSEDQRIKVRAAIAKARGEA